MGVAGGGGGLLKILVVDDHPLVRAGLEAVIASEEDMCLQGSVDSVADALDCMRRSPVDVVLLDLRLRSESGLDLVRQARREGLDCRFLVLTSATGQQDFRYAMDLNVEGYVLKDALPEELLLAIRIVSKGRRYFDPSFMGDLDGQQRPTHREG